MGTTTPLTLAEFGGEIVNEQLFPGLRIPVAELFEGI